MFVSRRGTWEFSIWETIRQPWTEAGNTRKLGRVNLEAIRLARFSDITALGLIGLF